MTRRIAGVLILLAGTAWGQHSFDVASVKATGPDPANPRAFSMGGGPGSKDPSRIAWTNVTMSNLLLSAFGVNTDQIYGPDWIKDFQATDRWAVSATMPADTTKEQFREMLQGLLKERFRMEFHHETRNFPGYELVVAPGGSKLKATAQDADVTAASSFAGGKPKGTGADGFPILAPGGATISMMGRGAMRQKYQAQLVTALAGQLGSAINMSEGVAGGRPMPRVVDKTGLIGKYDFTLEFDCPVCGGGLTTPGDSAGDPVPTYPNLFVALEKGLGLRLVKVKDVPVDVVVIDHIEKTSLPD